MTEPIELRPVVLWFAQQMELKLRANDHKGGWQDDEPEELAERISEELTELFVALKKRRAPQNWKRVLKEAADVANVAMMVADHARSGGPSEDQGRTL